VERRDRNLKIGAKISLRFELPENFKQKLVYFLRKNFTHLVIPDLIRNPVFSLWAGGNLDSLRARGPMGRRPAGVYPVLDTGRE
jgi:hypothetical protein